MIRKPLQRETPVQAHPFTFGGEDITARPLSISRWEAFVLQSVTQWQTYVKLLYLLVSVPVGVAVCLFLLFGLVTGILSVVVWIGVPLLYLMILAWWGLAIMETAMVRRWLKVEIPALPPSLLQIRRGETWRRLWLHLRQGITWKTLAYLLVKGPFAVAVTALTLVGIGFMLTAICAIPVVSFLAGPAFVVGMVVDALQKRGNRTIRLLQRACTMGAALVMTPLALLLVVADLWGMVARGLLSIDERERELLQARALLKRERARADRAEAQRRELVANLSHELRTPVANIRGHAESLLNVATNNASHPNLPEQHLAYLSIIHREAIRLGTLFDELLALTLDETQELRLSMGAVSLGEVVEEVHQTIKPLAYRQRRISLSRSVPSNLPNAFADRQRVQQVLLNLVRNAIAYTPEGGLVFITVSQPDHRHVALCVADTGVGIAPDEQARIFDRFYRPDLARDRDSGGFGLGLAIVRELVEAMGGSVSLESAVGEGSRFTITLPVA